MNPWLVRLRRRREMEQIAEAGMPLIPVDVPIVHAGQTVPVAATELLLPRYSPLGRVLIQGDSFVERQRRYYHEQHARKCGANAAASPGKDVSSKRKQADTANEHGG